jgi:hypothetical protein
MRRRLCYARARHRRESSGRRRRARAAPRGHITCAGVERARRGRARKTGEVRTRVSRLCADARTRHATEATQVREKRPGAGEEHERRRASSSRTRTGVERVRRGQARKNRRGANARSALPPPASARGSENAPCRRHYARLQKRVRAPAKSPSGAARAQLAHGNRAGAA